VNRSVRILEATAAVLSAGVLVVGVVLAVLLVAAPALNDGTGPRLDRVVVALLAGGLGELARWRRGRLPVRGRVALAGAVSVLVLAALWWGWWR
jgi:hypothetical protein